MSDIAIIGGTGHQGYGLALRWALGGKSITVGSRDGERAAAAATGIRELASRAGQPQIVIDGLENSAAAASASIVVITVPLAAQINTIKAIRDHLQAGTVLVDVTLPLSTAIGGRASRLIGLPAGSAAEQLAEYAPSHVQVVSAFHSLSADILVEIDADGPVAMDCDVIVCGGDARAQEIMRGLTQLLRGARYIHSGPLITSRLAEAAATLLIAINVRHKIRNSGLRITGVVE